MLANLDLILRTGVQPARAPRPRARRAARATPPTGVVQRDAMAAWEQGRSFRAVLEDDPEVTLDKAGPRRGVRPRAQPAPHRPGLRRPGGGRHTRTARRQEAGPVKPFSVRQGPRHLRRRRRPSADGHVRPDLGLRRGDGRADPRQGPGAHGHDRLLVRPAGRRGAQPPDSAWTAPAGAADELDDLAGRVMVVRRAEMLPIECIVRGYLSGLGVEGVPQPRHHARPAAAGGPARVRPAARAGVHPVDQGRRRATTRTSPSTQAVDLVGADGRRRRPATSASSLRPGRRVGRRAGHHHRRHQVRARLRRRRAGRLRRGAHARLVALLAGRPVGAGHARRRRSTSSRCATGSRPPAGTRRRRRRPCPPRWSRRPGSATSRPTSASPGARFADWPGAPGRPR